MTSIEQMVRSVVSVALAGLGPTEDFIMIMIVATMCYLIARRYGS